MGFIPPVAAGLALAAAFTASPVTVIALPLAIAVIHLAGRGLPEHERRSLQTILWVAFGARVAVIAALFLAGLPSHSDVSVGGLSGDDAYYFGRAIRARDLMLGFATTKYDYFVVNDEYGQTTYLKLLTWMQVVFGPTPYGMRVVNAAMYLAGGALLFRTVRRGFGSLPAFIGLIVLLFQPSLFFWSISLLKESMFFGLTALLVWCVMALPANQRGKTVAIVATAAMCLWLLDDLRRGALILAAAGIGLGLLSRVVLARSWSTVAAAIVIVLALSAGASSQTVRDRFTGAVASAARVQAGHVFTIGHAYKLLDEGFYFLPGKNQPQTLTLDQATRFVVRGAASFVLMPLPWQIESRGELALLPEHLLWYLTLVLAPIGCVAGWKRNPLLTCVLAGLALPTAAALALTNGNVGTLLRLRGLVTPQLAWIAAVGLVAVWETLLERTSRASGHPVIEGQPS